MDDVHHRGEAPIIVWFRKDLRTDDNRALASAAEAGRPVIALYIREDNAETGPLGEAQAWWLHHSLTSLSEQIEKRGTRLVLRSGNAETVLRRIVEETGASAIFWNRRYDPAGIAIDTALKEALSSDGIEAASFSGFLLHEPSRVKTKTGGPYRVYTPFWRAVEAGGEPDEPIDAPETLPAPSRFPSSEPLDAWNLLPKRTWADDFSQRWVPGEASALEKLEDFTESTIRGYRASRERTWEAGTSRLSPHLAMGEISPARIWHATRGLSQAESADVITFRKELVWREFAYHLLFHNPDMPTESLNRKYDRLGWSTGDKDFESWTRGRTGFPIVDAGMRELWRFGTMHNRVRMIVGSFLVKDLLIDWKRGERWFRDTLVDADPASNAMNWQWVAGCGADASPFFRVFNPITQGEKFDSDGLYVREHVPELADMPNDWIHHPFDAPAAVLAKAGVTLGKTYPKPIVDHAKARDRALAAYRNIKDAA
ncbi:deoxyribodipyrimidine photolyase [Rhizobium sp. Leaf384]|uniref:cryptochrome/photolyase family protein n=1 Tax=unclassified Rhizobium TaxID=2613769 RepID=UPI0007161A38|nr:MULTISPECIES: deoxyribodipyrimidine photo-lyase [unclassified Rhizobium]KQS74366.1 deoxyribodipyrimidine photolyase [Rhizobium sp. Leaf383]KQS80105.1 deoxyribodipyrimidine photolyase [Rhizobium sp. Leaf384]